MSALGAGRVRSSCAGSTPGRGGGQERLDLRRLAGQQQLGGRGRNVHALIDVPHQYDGGEQNEAAEQRAQQRLVRPRAEQPAPERAGARAASLMAHSFLAPRPGCSGVTVEAASAAAMIIGIDLVVVRPPCRPLAFLALHLAQQPHGGDELRRRHRLGVGRLVLAPDGGVDDAERQHQHGGQQVDGDGAGPARQEVAGIAQHRLGGGERLEARRLHRPVADDAVRRLRQSAGLHRHRLLDIADHRVLPAGEVGGAPVGGGGDEAAAHVVGGALDRRCHGGLLQRGDGADEAQRLGAEGVRPFLDGAAAGDQLAHPGDLGAAVLVELAGALAALHQLAAEVVQLVGHLGEKLHHRARAAGAGERAGALGFGEAGEARGGELDVGQQALSPERAVVRAVEVAGVVLQRHGEVLLDRRRAGQRRRVEPGGHGDDHQRAEHHGAEQPDPAHHVPHMRQELHEHGPEGVDRHRHRGRIDQRGEEGHDRRAVEQVAHPEIGVDAGGEREDTERDAHGDVEPGHAGTQR